MDFVYRNSRFSVLKHRYIANLLEIRSGEAKRTERRTVQNKYLKPSVLGESKIIQEVKGKVNVKLYLCLTKCQAMEMYGGVEV